MALIRPCADLRNNYNEISKLCHETKEPIYITRNGTNDLVILSDELYEIMLKTVKESEEERIDRLISESFDKHYATFEKFQKDIYNKIEQALKDIEEGRYTTMENAVAELEEKYGVSKKIYEVIWLNSFKNELSHIYHYLSKELKECCIANKFHIKVFNSLSYLSYYPEIYKK